MPINNKPNLRKGTYPGSGVSTGGQQGKLAGNRFVAGKSGGKTAAASQPKLGAGNSFFFNTKHMGTGYYNSATGKTETGLKKPTGNVRFGANPLQFGGFLHGKNGLSVPTKPAGMESMAAGSARATMAAPSAAPGIVDEFGIARDSGYFDELRQGQRAYDDSVNPLLSELQGLQSKGYGGKTLYDLMYDRAQNNFRHSVRDTRDQHNEQGLLWSGSLDRTAAGLSDNFMDQSRQLDTTYGSGRINTLNSQIAQQQSQLAEQKRLMALAAAARLQEQQAAMNAANYGMTIMGEE